MEIANKGLKCQRNAQVVSGRYRLSVGFHIECKEKGLFKKFAVEKCLGRFPEVCASDHKVIFESWNFCPVSKQSWALAVSRSAEFIAAYEEITTYSSSRPLQAFHED